jgi:hypothetical protein
MALFNKGEILIIFWLAAVSQHISKSISQPFQLCSSIKIYFVSY